MKWWMIMLIIIIVVVVIMIILYKLGDKLQKKQLNQKQQMLDAAQPQTMMIIDKKMLPMKDAGLPKIVMEQTPKRYQKAKLPIVKAKIGPQIMNFIADDAIFDELPTRCEVKAMVSGIYILSVKSTRGKKAAQSTQEENGKKRKSFRTRMAAKQAEYQRQLNDELLAKKQNEEKGIKTKTKAELKKEQARAKKITDGIK
ncbi:MAG: hypothetical protein J6B39_09140 [Lachnospiraceae bacterium]|nr:hypothetical protein [Lachnospiraceae bacterium]MBO5509160.1 hypothetical protein [Lachnospiraceae bacterium]